MSPERALWGAFRWLPRVRGRFGAGILAVALGAASLRGGLHAEERAAPPQATRETVRAFLKDHCLRCHNRELAKGGIVLQQFALAPADGPDLGRWEQVLDVLESGEMPPRDQKQPAAADRKAVASWIETELRAGLARNRQREGAAEEAAIRAPAVRRLTNVEYENTVRDLVGFRIKLIDRLPQDPVRPYHFNNTAELMRLGPEQIERYLECARRVMASAIVDPGTPPVHATRREWNSGGVDRGLGADEIGVWGNRRGTAAKGMTLTSYPRTGEYRIRIQASAILPAGVQEVPLRLVMGYGGLDENQSTHRIETVGTVALRNSPAEPRVFEFRGRIENHPPRPGKQRNGRQQPDTLTITPQNLYDDGTLNDANDFSRTRNVALPRAVVNWIEFEAPLCEPWPPEHHTRILFESPLRESDPPAYAREVLQRFLSRAYRRPAVESEVQRFAKIYELLLPTLKTEEATFRETLAMVLISPQFLYHTVPDARTSRHYALASKLSYFVWATMPDEELLELAADQRLDEPAVLEAQVRRMVRDDRSRDFVENFTRQWLSLDKLQTVPINRDLFPRFLYYVPRGERAGTEEPYRPTIRDYMLQETVGFVGELLRRNASLLEIVDSDFAFLNQPLAAHYGVDGVRGNQLRPVPIAPQHRLGGLLTHGSVLIGNGTGSAPHPIYRAVWLREAILGDEVPAPPAEVPALADSAGDAGDQALSIKALLAEHRQVEGCNDCHSRLDPWGIPFERYNAIGKYQSRVPREGTRVRGFDRAQDGDLTGYARYLASINSEEIDAATRLPDGTPVDGLGQLKAYLLEHRRSEIVENVVRRLLAYGIGRDLSVEDRFEVKRLVKRVEQENYRLQDVIVAICQSDTFLAAGPGAGGK